MNIETTSPFLRGLKHLKHFLAGLLVVAIRIPAGITQASADEIQIAVAANFLAPAQILASKFGAATGNHVALSAGATGALFAQINQGAPFVAFLAADQETPQKLVQQGRAFKESQFTYAIGKLVLWSSDATRLDGTLNYLREGKFSHLAIANPKVAPYGRAAQEVLEKLGLYESLKSKLVIGENISQTFQFVSSGNAEIGFVAASQVVGDGNSPAAGSLVNVPSADYSPIVQDAVLLKPVMQVASLAGVKPGNSERPNTVAEQFLKFLASSESQAIIRSFGYDLPNIANEIGLSSRTAKE